MPIPQPKPQDYSVPGPFQSPDGSGGGQGQQRQPYTPPPQQLEQSPQPYPAYAGFAGKGGQVANIASNLVQGWFAGQNYAAQKKMQSAISDVQQSRDTYAFLTQQYRDKIDAGADPNSDDMKKLGSLVAQNFKEYVNTMGKYVGQDDQQQGGKKKSTGQKLKQGFAPGMIPPELIKQHSFTALQQLSQQAEKDPSILLPGQSLQTKAQKAELEHQARFDKETDEMFSALDKGDMKTFDLLQAHRDIELGKDPRQGTKERLMESWASDIMAGKTPDAKTTDALTMMGLLHPKEPTLIQRQTTKNGKTVSEYVQLAIDPKTGQYAEVGKPIPAGSAPYSAPGSAEWANLQAQGRWHNQEWQRMNPYATWMQQHPGASDADYQQAAAVGGHNLMFGSQVKNLTGPARTDARRSVLGDLNQDPRFSKFIKSVDTNNGLQVVQIQAPKREDFTSADKKGKTSFDESGFKQAQQDYEEFQKAGAQQAIEYAGTPEAAFSLFPEFKTAGMGMTPTPGGTGKIAVVGPNGERGTIPPSSKKAFADQGWKNADGSPLQ